MEYQNLKPILPAVLVVALLFLVLAGFTGYAFTRISALTEQTKVFEMELASTTEALSRNTSKLSQNITDLRLETVGLSNKLSSTEQNINAVKTQVGGVEQTVGSISGTVGNLQKLSQIDSALLRKYSKVYFTNENYVPAHLTDIPTDYRYSQTRSEQFLTEAWPFLKRMLDSAKAVGVTLQVKSAYRSFAEQQMLKSAYTVVYGAGTANSFAADQGYSEHQLGTTLDFVGEGSGGKVDGFEKTETYRWLTTNAHLFGFELSYPKGNIYYVYEPWHWRFVGVKLATYLHDNKLNFYEVEQREIDAYLISIFD